METTFRIASETYAEKTRRLLTRQQIPFRVQRTTTPQGCAAKFHVSASPEYLAVLLRTHQIPFHMDA